MKKLITFLILLFAVSAYSGTLLQIQESIIAKKRGVASCDTSNIIFWYRCESDDFTATSGTLDYSVGDKAGTTNGGIAFNTDAVKYGTNGMDVPTGADFIYFAPISATLDDEGRLGFWVYINTWVENAEFSWIAYDDASNLAKLFMSGADELGLTWEDSGTERTTLVTSNANLSTGTWYFIEVAWKTSTDLREIYVNGTECTYSAGEGATIASFAGDVIRTYFGETAGENSDYYMDNIIISTDSTDDLYTTCKDELEWPE